MAYIPTVKIHLPDGGSYIYGNLSEANSIFDLGYKWWCPHYSLEKLIITTEISQDKSEVWVEDAP